jgi:hypothetical protein
MFVKYCLVLNLIYSGQLLFSYSKKERKGDPSANAECLMPVDSFKVLV